MFYSVLEIRVSGVEISKVIVCMSFVSERGKAVVDEVNIYVRGG